MSDSIEVLRPLVAQWMAEHFKAFKPNIDTFLRQLVEDKGIDSVNQLADLIASGGMALYAEHYFQRLKLQLSEVNSNRLPDNGI